MQTNIIYNEDCFDVMARMEDKSIDAIITDPPYLMNYKTNYRKDKEHRFCKTILNDNNTNFVTDFVKQSYRILKNNTSFYCFCNSNKIDIFKQEIEKLFTIKNIIIWVKNNWTAGDLLAQYGKQYEFIIYANKGRCELNEKRETDVWFEDRIVGKNQEHQNEKPIKLITKIIEKSTKPNAVIFDHFLGSGTTAIACKITNRQYIGCEIDPEYYKIAINRIEKSKTMFD